MDNIETRVKALEYELSQIVDSEYLNELNKYSNKDLQKNLVINIIPSKDISFKTRALLSDILDRLELTRQDRQDLEKYIIYGGGENIEYIKFTIGDLLNKVPELNYLIDNIQTVIPLLNKLDELFKDTDENLDSFKELYDTLKLLKTSINDLNTTHNKDIKNITSLLNTINQIINNDVLLKKDSLFEKGSGKNSAILKDGNNKADGYLSVAIGNNTEAKGNRSFTQGEGTVANNIAEVAFGRYNNSNDNTLFSIGFGKSHTSKNAIEVTKDGDVYITGIGGYDSTNPTTAKSVQEVINELVNKLNEITTND